LVVSVSALKLHDQTQTGTVAGNDSKHEFVELSASAFLYDKQCHKYHIAIQIVTGPF